MTLANKVDQFNQDADKLRAVLSGPASGAGSTVDTGGAQPVRTLAKINADLDSAGVVGQVLTAKAQTEAARDAALIGPGAPYTTEALGRAAVADGAVFRVQGAGDVAVFEYRRVNSGASTLIATYPSLAAVAQARYQVQGKVDTYTTDTEFNNGTALGTATLVWTRLYIIAGAAQLKVAAGNFVVAANEALVVDLDQVPNGSGEYVVTKVAAPFYAADYTTGRKLVLYTQSQGRVSGALVPAAHHAKLAATDAAQAVTNTAAAVRADTNELGRWQAHGRFTTAYVDFGTNGLVVAWSLMRLFRGAQNANPKEIAPLAQTTLANGQCLYIDTAAALDGSGRYVVQVGNPYTMGSAFEGVKDTKIILLSTASSPTSVGGILADRFLAQSLAPSGRSLGHVVIPDAGVTVSFDPSTRTLAWSGRVYFMTNDFGRRIRVGAGSIQFPAGPANERYVAYLDTNAAAEVAGETPFANCIKFGRYYDGATPFIGENWQIPLFCYNAGQYYPLMGLADVPISYPGTAVSDDTIIVDHSAGLLKVYVKGAKEGGTRYIVYEFRHQTGTLSGSGLNAPYDVWRLTWMREVNRTGPSSFVGVRDICNDGEAECAIQEQGKADFIGGMNHGNEIFSVATLLVDGVPRDLATTGIYTCKRLQLFVASVLNRHGDSATTLADKYIYWDVTRGGGLQLRNTIKWRVGGVVVTRAYMTMLGIYRRNPANTESITDAGAREPLWLPEPMATDGSFAEVRSLARYAKAWGPNGISAEVEILQAPSIDNWQFYFAQFAGRNKFYFGDIPSPYVTTTAGMTWECRSRIKLDTTN